jgi:hypothetical protein
VLVLVEVTALIAGALLLVASVVRGSDQVGTTLATAVFLAGLAGLLLAAARALARGRRWGRAPVVTWQLLQGAIGLTQAGTAPAVGVALVVAAALVLGGLLAPASVAATSATGADAGA